MNIKKKIMMYAFLMVFTISLIIITSEVVIRAAGISSKIAYLPNKLYGWGHAPNIEYTNLVEDRKIPVKINSKGLRDKEYEYITPPHTLRTILLGDSFTEALQVPANLSFSELAEQNLNKVLARNNFTIDIINTGVSGYGTDNELLFYQAEAKKYNSDIVILFLYVGNDIRNNWYKLENIDVGGFRKPYFTSQQGNKLLLHPNPDDRSDSVYTKIKLFLNQHLRLYAFLRRLRDQFQYKETLEKTGIPLDYNIYRKDYSPDWQTAWEITKTLLKELNNTITSQNKKFVVFLIPSQLQIHKNYWRKEMETYKEMQHYEWDLNKPNRLLNNFLDANQIEHIDLMPHLLAAYHDSGKELYLKHDAHWNERGHHVVSKLLTNFLLEKTTGK